MAVLAGVVALISRMRPGGVLFDPPVCDPYVGLQFMGVLPSRLERLRDARRGTYTAPIRARSDPLHERRVTADAASARAARRSIPRQLDVGWAVCQSRV